MSPTAETEVVVPVGDGRTTLDGTLSLPRDATGVVLFAHGSGSSRRSVRNRFVARVLTSGGLGTLLFDLLTPEEEVVDAVSGHLRFDIEFLARRLEAASRWAHDESWTRDLRQGFFGASTGGAAALVAAATLGDRIGAVVSRGGRPDLAASALHDVRSPTLLLVGGEDGPVVELNRWAYAELSCTKRLDVIPGAGHLFEERGTLEDVAARARDWFAEFLASPVTAGGASSP